MHWYVIANQKEVKIYVRISRKNQLRLMETLVNPLGSEKKSDLIRKQAGRGVKSFGKAGFVTYSETKRHDPRDEVAKQFAKEVSNFLNAQRSKKNFTTLTIVSEPRFLGKIKAEMGRDLLKTVSYWVRKDLLKTPQDELTEILFTDSKNNFPN